jgi:hypothetical protein
MDTTITAPTYRAWAEALDSLERELDWASDLEADAASAWTPPSGLGALPPELADRAMRILTAQRDLATRLDGERRVTGRHLAATRTVPAVAPVGASVYLDVAG